MLGNCKSHANCWVIYVQPTRHISLTMTDSQIVRDMQQIHGTGWDSKRQPETIGDRERHVETPWDRSDSERHLAIWVTVRYMWKLYGTGVTVGENEKPRETVRDMQQLLRTRMDSERQPAKIRDSERHLATPWTGETVRNSHQLWETVRDMKQLNGTGRESERQPAKRDSERQQPTMGKTERHLATPWNWRDSRATIGECETHVATTWDQSDSERQPANVRDSKKHAANQWNWKREWETASNNGRQWETWSKSIVPERKWERASNYGRK